MSTRVLSPAQALAMASVLNVVGVTSGTAVAATTFPVCGLLAWAAAKALKLLL